MKFNPDQAPGFKEAVEKEQWLRDASFVPVTESIGGFPVVPMTLLQYIQLRVIKNPILADLKTSPEQLAAFLWLLNPEYRPERGRAKRKFMRRCRQFFPPERPLLPTGRAVRRWKRKAREHFYNFSVTLKSARVYMEETMMDRPGVKENEKAEYHPDYCSDAATLCGLLARENHWAEKDILSLPMKRIFGYVNDIKQRYGSTDLHNRLSDDARNNWLLEYNRNGGVN